MVELTQSKPPDIQNLGADHCGRICLGEKYEFVESTVQFLS